MTSLLHVERYGDPGAPPLLAVHGITGFGARFGRLADRLPDRRWLCPDLRGHGRSPAPGPWRTEEHIRDLLAVLDDDGIDRADIIAHSFGGHVALHLLAAAPDRVGRLVLLDPASLLDPEHAEARAIDYARDPGWETEEEARAEIGSWFPNEGAKADLPLELEHNLVRDDEGRWRMRFSPAVIVTAYGEMCRPVPELPSDRDVLLVEADPEHTTVHDALRRALEQAFADRLQRQVVSGSTHVLFRTELDGTVAAIGPFLTG